GPQSGGKGSVPAGKPRKRQDHNHIISSIWSVKNRKKPKRRKSAALQIKKAPRFAGTFRGRRLSNRIRQNPRVGRTVAARVVLDSLTCEGVRACGERKVRAPQDTVVGNAH